MLPVFRSASITSVPPFSWCFANSCDDSYAVVSEYYGRGLFNKVTVITEGLSQETPAPASAPAPAPAPAPLNYGPGAEAKLRLQEGQSKQVFISNATKQVPPKGTTIVPIPEGRMRMLEQTRYSSSLEANMNKLEPVHKSPKKEEKISTSPSISSAIINGQSPSKNTGRNLPGSNPFEENYDESKNPFADEGNDPTNPFNDDGYDKSLNPFS